MEKNIKEQKPSNEANSRRRAGELLIPAGGPAQFIAAAENGADAVYIGGKSFSARAGAENFTDEEAERAADYGHLRGVKTYVTMNTLLEESELEAALRQAEKYRRMGIDGIIIQDLGLGRLVRETMPDMPIHLSTQAGVYDADGAVAAAKLGYERVVLARELTFEEIRAVNDSLTDRKTGEQTIQTEVFVHGALCFCYSGQCQLSRHIGGRSGNRGTCAQPCRLPYSGFDGQKYPLSPGDICLVEELGKLCEAGVASFKVEGRMKSPEYVAVVTSIYRKYLDMWEADGDYIVTPEDMESLRQIFNRGGFTKGYFYGDPGYKLMTEDSPKNRGIYMGRAGNVRGSLIEIETSGSAILPEKGDYIEIRGEDPAASESRSASFLVTYLKKEKDGLFIAGDIKKSVQTGACVYRLTSGRQMEEARRTFKDVKPDGDHSRRKSAVYMKASVRPENGFYLSASAMGRDGIITVRGASCSMPEPSRSGRYCSDSVKKQLQKTGQTAFSAVVTEVEEPEAAFVSVADVNALRREVLSRLEEKVRLSYKRRPLPEPELRAAARSGGADYGYESDTLELWFYSLSELREKAEELKKVFSSGPDKIRILVPLEDYSGAKETIPGMKIRPYLKPVIKGTAAQKLAADIDKIAAALRGDGCGVYAGNIGQIQMFASRGIDVYADYGINTTNSQAAAACRELGAAGAAPSLEHASSDDGAYPLMLTEHRFGQEESVVFTDRKGEQYRSDFDVFTHKTTVRAAGRRRIPEKKAGRIYL